MDLLTKLIQIAERTLLEVSVSDYFQDTRGEWRGLSAEQTKKFLKAYFAWRRKRNKPDYIEVDGKKYSIDYQSIRKNRFFRSRSISIYFIEKGSDRIIRISDHWSKSDPQFSRSRKLNCGMIRGCYWSLNGGEPVIIRFPGERWESRMLGGEIRASELERY